MKDTRLIWLVALAVGVVWGRQANAQNLLVDGGFENPALYTQDGAPFVGFWEAFNGGGTSSSVNDTLLPHSGARDVRLSIIASNNNFAGMFQDVPVTAGISYIYSGFHESNNLNPADYVTEVRIEWRSSVSNTEISRNQKLPIAGGQYTPFSMTAAAPAGADTARVVYTIQTFTDTGATNTGNVFVDDLSVSAVPEPSTMAVAALGGLALLAAQRHEEIEIGDEFGRNGTEAVPYSLAGNDRFHHCRLPVA